MGRRDPGKMTPKAQIAFEIYRDLGPGRTLAAAAEALEYSPRSISVFRRWSSAHEWQRLIAEHDHAALKEALGQREIIRERTLQSLVDKMDEAATVLSEIMSDASALPVFDRHGKQMEDGEGEPLWKAAVKASTRLEAAKTLLGLTGLVPVKRTEHVDRTAEGLDAAANVLRSMSPKQVEQLIAILDASDDEP